MTYTPDFIVDLGLDKPVAVEIKGHGRAEYKMRKKLFVMFYSEDYYFLELMKEDLKPFEEWLNNEEK